MEYAGLASLDNIVDDEEGDEKNGTSELFCFLLLARDFLVSQFWVRESTRHLPESTFAFAAGCYCPTILDLHDVTEG